MIREIRRYEFETRNSNIIWAIDHTPDLLSKARVSRGSGEFWMACLFYATWVEHHLNFMLSSVGHRHGLPDSAIKQIIRGTQTQTKIVMWPLFGFKPIAKQHQLILARLADLRNYFVHYKWQYSDDDSKGSTQEKEAQSILGEIEKTVSYLQRYDNSIFLSGARSRLNRIVRQLTSSKENEAFCEALRLALNSSP